MNNYTPVRTITKIEANPILTSKKDEYRRLRVAAYCRVSTDEEDQLSRYPLIVLCISTK